MLRSSDVLDGLTLGQRRSVDRGGPGSRGSGNGQHQDPDRRRCARNRRRGIPASRILAVTFTNKAAAEMLSCIRATLGAGAAPRWVGTLHGLGARQLRIEPEIADLRPGFDIMDADDSHRIIKRVTKG